MALGPEERRLLAAFAEIHTPTPADATAALARVRVRIDREKAVATASARRRVVVGVGILAAAAALVLGLRLELVSMLTEQRGDASESEAAYAQPDDAADADGEAIDREQRSRQVDRRTDADVLPDVKIEQPAPDVVRPSERAKPQRDPGTRSKRRAQPNASDATLHAEMALLRPAQQALHGGNHRKALELFDAHARSFPSSALAEERTLGRIEALCGLGRGDEARKAAASFGSRFPGSPLRGKAQRACPAESKP